MGNRIRNTIRMAIRMAIRIACFEQNKSKTQKHKLRDNNYYLQLNFNSNASHSWADGHATLGFAGG